MQIFKYIIVLAASAVGAISDYKYYKIRNNITVPTAILGLVLALVDENLAVWESLVGFILPFIICLVFYKAKMLRAGDIKLFMCIGAVMGYKWIINCMAASVIAGGVFAVVIFIKRRCFISRFKKLFRYLKNMLYSGMFFEYTEAEEENGRFPFGVSIFAGTAVTVVLETLGMYMFFKVI